MKDEFYKLSDALFGRLRGDEVLLCVFGGEESQFVRFNHNLIRQAGDVRQMNVSLQLIRGQRHSQMSLTLAGDLTQDEPAAVAALEQLRGHLEVLGDDPYLLYSQEVRSSERNGENRLGDARTAVEEILQQGRGLDLVGLLAQGGIYAGFANSLGQRNWFSSYSFHFDWSLYHRADKAVKSSYAGFAWDGAELGRKMASCREQFAMLQQPAKTIAPGHYRVYLAPEALADMVGMVAGGFGLKSHRTMTTPMLRMSQEGVTLNEAVTLRENTREGIAPDFGAAGFIKHDSITLVEKGRLGELLVSPRSAREYDAAPNSGESECPESLDMAAGEIDADAILGLLGTGIYINQLHYLNYSDVPACRITGMTRFATFWVEEGRIVAPLNVMRFDETAYRVLGSNLRGLTRQRDFIPDAATYGGRSTSSMRLGGALVDDFAFTL